MEFELYKMNFEEGNNETIQIVGDYFVKINKNKGKLIINNKKHPLKGVLPTDIIKTNKIQMILSTNIYNKSCMFKNCKSLKSISNSLYIDNIQDSLENNEEYDIHFQKENEEKIYNYFNNENDSSFNNTDDSFIPIVSTIQKEDEKIFDNKNVSSLKNEINNLIVNHTIFNEIFSNCITLFSLPDISNWDFSDITDASKMFYNCSSLTTLPDISVWKTDNAIDMSYMFYNCKKLISLPDISEWKTANITNTSYMFSGCESLTSLPDISMWNMNKVLDISYMFSNCTSLTTLPDISNWNVYNIMLYVYRKFGDNFQRTPLYRYCENLLSSRKISKWNVTNISGLFSNCKSLKYLPDI